jgi:hypothetical protein
LFGLAATAAHRAHQAEASCAGSLASQIAVPSTIFHFAPQPNITLQLTPTASLLVPSAALRRR